MLEHRALQCYGHVNRMQNRTRPKRITEWSPGGISKRGRPALSWELYIREIRITESYGEKTTTTLG